MTKSGEAQSTVKHAMSRQLFAKEISNMPYTEDYIKDIEVLTQQRCMSLGTIEKLIHEIPGRLCEDKSLLFQELERNIPQYKANRR